MYFLSASTELKTDHLQLLTSSLFSAFVRKFKLNQHNTFALATEP